MLNFSLLRCFNLDAPFDRSSITMTSPSLSRSASTICDPMKPSPPVTTNFLPLKSSCSDKVPSVPDRAVKLFKLINHRVQCVVSFDGFPALFLNNSQTIPILQHINYFIRQNLGIQNRQQNTNPLKHVWDTTHYISGDDGSARTQSLKNSA